MLTEQQRRHFETFGFIVWRQLFPADEIASIAERFEQVLAEDRSGREFEGDKRQAVTGFLERRDDLIELLEDDRIFSSIQQLLGPDFVWIGSDGNLYVGDTRWHPDNQQKYRRIKVAFYLDKVTKDTGCLRVIPGSHQPVLHGQLKEQWPTEDAADSPYGVAGSQIPSFPLESDPGDVVFFNQNLWHAAYGGRTGRRMFTFNFGEKPKSDADYTILRDLHKQNVGFVDKMAYTKTDRIYTDSFLHHDSPRIQSMVNEIVAMGLR